jgi:sec-independent protein translocase protein TatB
MFSLGGWGEILIIVVAALILIGPKELPEVLRACGRWVYRFRRMSTQFRQGFDTLLQEGQLEEFERAARKTADELNTLIKQDDDHPTNSL